MKYKRICRWKRKPVGAPDADVAIKYIEGIKRKRGGITPKLLVMEAKTKKSPLHDCFEWNNNKAAKEYREIQARRILRFLVISEIEDDEEPESFVRAFVAASEITENEKSSRYLTIKEIRDDEDLDKQYKEQLLSELYEINHRIKAYDEFSLVVHAIERVKI
ncbi:hypothetical protein LCGC14_0434300 [marine sediment metagenome]|uniref:Uncharacterized protein n=1 Tax=marine sediment metagenome TaxID=412755 RepID=A0A0F9SM74_9ZZZZ|nr:hypothetical protein [Pricia sp.]